MKVFNSLEEMEPYYNAGINMYYFIENNRVTDIEINFDLKTESDISASSIKARNIESGNIWVGNIIEAKNIKAKYFDSEVVIKSQKS